MTVPAQAPQVAVYIDFDNVAISRYDELHGKSSFREDGAGSKSHPPAAIKQRLIEAHLDLKAIVECAAAIGTVSIARAYANWASPVNSSYRRDTLSLSIDLVQLFPMNNSKNGADIRLAIDVVDDLIRYPHLTHVVIVAGDSDYVSLAQRCKRLGRTVTGIGVSQSVGQYWKASCDDFVFYSDLVSNALIKPLQADPAEELPIVSEDPHALLGRAVSVVAGDGDGGGWIPLARIKPVMKRFDPSFDEKVLGYGKFVEFVEACPTIVEVSRVDGEVRVRSAPTTHASPTTFGAETPIIPDSTREFTYRRTLGLTAMPYLAPEVEQMWVRGVRTAWNLVSDPDRPRDKLSGTDLLAAVVSGGATEQLAKRVMPLVLQLPVLLHDDEMNHRPNDQLEGLTDTELTTTLRWWLMTRTRVKLFPEVVQPADLATATHGPNPSAAVVHDYEFASKQPIYNEMLRCLVGLHVPPPMLFDVIESMKSLKPGDLIPTPSHLEVALTPRLLELGRDCDSIGFAAAHLTLSMAGIFHAASGRLTAEGAQWLADGEGYEAVCLMWLHKIRQFQIPVSGNVMILESVYRLLLPDRHDLASRQWARAVADEVAAA